MNATKLKRLRSKVFRDAFVNANINQGLAYQIRALRESRGWDQKELAKKIGLRSQSAIARMEDPSYGKLSVASLKRLGRAFDVGLLIKFVPYSRLLVETENLSEECLAAKSFNEEEAELSSMVKTLNGYKIFTPLTKGGDLRPTGIIENKTSYSAPQTTLKPDLKEASYV